MAADDALRIPELPLQLKRRTPRKVRDELTRIRRAMDKTQRDAKSFIISDYEDDIPKGVNEESLSREANLMVRVKASGQDPSKNSSITAEAVNPEVEWALSRTSNAKRSARGYRRIVSH